MVGSSSNSKSESSHFQTSSSANLELWLQLNRARNFLGIEPARVTDLTPLLVHGECGEQFLKHLQMGKLISAFELMPVAMLCARV